MDDAGYKGFRDRAAHDRAHDLLALPSWHPEAPKPSMRHMLRAALRRCLTTPGYCDYASEQGLSRGDSPATQSGGPGVRDGEGDAKARRT